MSGLTNLFLWLAVCLSAMANSGSDDTKTWGTTTSETPAMMTGWVFVLVGVVIAAVLCTGICIPIVVGRSNKDY